MLNIIKIVANLFQKRASYLPDIQEKQLQKAGDPEELNIAF